MKQTLDMLATNVALCFPRGNIASWQSYFDTNLENWLYELCDFPFWFLRQEPSPAFYNNFPCQDYSTIPLVYGRWAATGWLITEPGVTQYSLASPLEEDHEADPAWWSIFRAASIDSAKVYDHAGRIVQDLEMLPPNEFYDYYYSGGTQVGTPRYMTLRTTEVGSSLVFWPRSTQSHPIAVRWTLRESPPYQDPAIPSNHYARFLTWAPSAVLAKCLLQTAIFFNESEMAKEFAAQLYGANAPKQDFSSMAAVGGIIGALKEETYRKTRQTHQQVKMWQSCAAATGRRNPGGRYLPLGYGYRL